MAQTIDVLAKMDWNEDGHELMSIEQESDAVSIGHVAIHRVTVDTTTTNFQVQMGSNFNTATYVLLKETAGYTFTYSRNGNTHHHLVNANGFAMWNGNTTGLYISNNNTGTTAIADITIILGGT